MIQENILSKKQNEILTFIKKYIAKNGYSPSVREIANSVGLSSPATVHVHLQNLISKGYLKRDNDTSKSLELLVPNEFEIHDGDAIAVPYIQPNFVKNLEYELEHPDEFFYLTSDMISWRSDVFVMAISNNQFSSFGIIRGDNVIVEINHSANNGFIVLFDDEHNITIQNVSKEKPIDKSNVIGKVIALFREY